MTSLKDIRLFTTQPHRCSYLPDQEARTLFIDPDFQVGKDHNTRLSEIGFRRSGGHVYRPNCQYCQQCLSCRVLVQQFQPSRRFERVLKRNADVHVEAVESIADDEYFLLYRHYITVRHGDGDMYPPSREQYQGFLLRQCEGTRYFTLRAGGRLLGVLVCDQLETGLSAVYTFYDPLEEKRSLGTFSILWQIAETRRLGLSYLYLGYWIRDSRKMRYKVQYRPLEVLVRQRWVLFSETLPDLPAER
jgi:arginyl-tRNA--protein-N-Asp/Glu arginylyltransferase